jgi:hypothetical protein
MTKREKRVSVRPPGGCIFGHKGQLSKEHFWSAWMEELFPKEAAPAHHEYFSARTKKTILVGQPRLTTRQGAAITKKLRVVCRDCNHGWMKALEEQARPILTPLIRGEPINLDLDQQRTLAEWITLKAMIAEHNVPADVVVPEEDRVKFFTDRAIPSYIHIWVISSQSEKWRARYIRHTATFSLPGTLPATTGKNTQTIAWGLGRLFLLVMMSTATGVDLNNFIRIHPVVPKLFPYSGNILPLPFLKSIDDASGDRLAAALDELILTEKVIYKDLPA